MQHLISDAATMQIIRWTDGGFGMACHNYDGDMLTDEVAQVHRSPGFITSNLIGKREDGALIKEFEAMPYIQSRFNHFSITFHLLILAYTCIRRHLMAPWPTCGMLTYATASKEIEDM